ncbi:DNA mismatch repair protein MutT, partial [Francisella tularensis subsp. holarctica]|nr:DNA mismatch repair protein MutT [Francisella tularensis subsp. holarctica]
SLVFLAQIIGGENTPTFEVKKVGFFEIDKLPKVSHKLTKTELNIILEAYKQEIIYFE